MHSLYDMQVRAQFYTWCSWLALGLAALGVLSLSSAPQARERPLIPPIIR